jgi:hypothetical protein
MGLALEIATARLPNVDIRQAFYAAIRASDVDAYSMCQL